MSAPVAPSHVKCSACRQKVRVSADDVIQRHRTKNGRRCSRTGTSAAVMLRAARRNKEMTQ